MTINNTPPITLSSSAHDNSQVPYLLQGAKLLLRPGYKRFILIPIACSVILFIASLFVLISLLQSITAHYTQWIPAWLQAVEVIMWIIVGFGITFLYSLTFTSVTNLIAAPFNGFLAEKIQADFTGEAPPSCTLWQMTTRTITRELQKLLYFIGYGIGISLFILVTSPIPVVNVITPFLGIAWACWSLSIQYIDYVADNNHISFKTLRRWCGERRLRVIFYGGSILLTTLIPVLNIMVMSAAVAGGTLFWLKERQS